MAERQQIIRNSRLYGHYEQLVDRESAYEILKARAATSPEQAPAEADHGFNWGELLGGSTGPRGGHREGIVEVIAKSTARSLGAR